jgi:hypothetical protein
VTAKASCRAPLAAVLGSIAAACAGPPYFTEPDTIAVGAPIELGKTVYVGPAYLDARRGDRLELVSAEAIGLDATIVTYLAAQVSELGEASVGTELATPERPLGEMLHPLVGYTFTEADGTVEVVLAIIADAPGVLTFEALRLRFRVNGREREQRFPFGGRICFESPKPQNCDPPA